MSTKLSEAEWTVVLRVFRACQSGRGGKGRDDRKVSETLHYLPYTTHLAGAAGRVRAVKHRVAAVLALEPM